MPGFLTNTTNVQLTDIINLTNASSLPEFAIKADLIMFGGVFWSIMLWLTVAVLFFAAQKRNPDQPMQNLFYSFGIISIIAILARSVTALIGITTQSLINDHQMWIFPVITMILGAILWATKDR